MSHIHTNLARDSTSTTSATVVSSFITDFILCINGALEFPKFVII